VLDLVDRKGKYENGFMHGPVPAWREDGRWRPARIQFTANAIPGQVGVGRRATETLFHEGGHAAHFANIDMPAPCFAQEFAPQFGGDGRDAEHVPRQPARRSRTGRRATPSTRDGAPMPRELILKGIEIAQPMAAWNVRAMCSVCYAERALYEIPDGELTPERVLREMRAIEERLLFLEGGSPRPTLAVPHLLSGESSAYYHGYVLAEMAVQQTRDFFRRRDGHLVDNPRIGPDLREHYWRPGNALTFFAFRRKPDRRAAHGERAGARSESRRSRSPGRSARRPRSRAAHRASRRNRRARRPNPRRPRTRDDRGARRARVRRVRARLRALDRRRRSR
jgi:hypothetical protein